jgi:hypothetical protein
VSQTARLCARSLALAVVLFVGLAGLAGPAGATSSTKFGSKLAAPDVSFGCSVYPTTDGFFATHASRCIWTETTSGTSSPVGSDLIPAGTGTLTKASVRVGHSTGPMRFVMVRALVPVDDPVESSCCVVLLQSKKFTPKRNTTTTETVDFPIKKNNSVSNPSGDDPIEIADILGLQILSSSTTIPLTAKTNRALNKQPADYEWFGSFTPGTAELFDDSLGYQLDIRGTYVPG